MEQVLPEPRLHVGLSFARGGSHAPRWRRRRPPCLLTVSIEVGRPDSRRLAARMICVQPDWSLVRPDPGAWACATSAMSVAVLVRRTSEAYSRLDSPGRQTGPH